MKSKYVAALDQGTTSSRCIIFDSDGSIVSVAQQEIERTFPRPGWVEQSPNEIWSSQLGVFTQAIAHAHITPSQIATVGITNQRETTILWDRETGQPIYNAIVWQCRRGAPYVQKAFDAGLGEMIRSKTGLIADAYFSATKIAWILDNVPGAREKAEAGNLLFGTVDTWLIYNLTGGAVHATDYTNASRTMLFNIHTLAWDDELLDLWDIPAAILPEARPSTGDFGSLDNSLIGEGISITGVLGDQQAALFGQCCFEQGEAKNTYGTGCFLLMNTGDSIVDSEHGLLSTIAYSDGNSVQYALEGSVFNAGSAIKWLRDGLELIRDASETGEGAYSVPDNAGVYLVPAFNGLGAPYWNQQARGILTGLTQGSTRNHIIRATLESLAYQSRDVLVAMERDSGITLKGLRVDGGVSSNDFVMQFQSDIMDIEVRRPIVVETTALGAAYAAGLAVGMWESKEELCTRWAIDRTFESSIDQTTRSKWLAGWDDAIARALLGAE